MSGAWRDQIAGARMRVDQRFTDRVLESEFSNQQWSLIMTAVEFEVESPTDPDEAELVANTEKVPQIMPELDNVPQGGAPGGPPRNRGSETGLLSRLGSLLGGGESNEVDDDRLDAATALVEEYADQLQAFLEEQGRWEAICEQAAQAEE